MPEAVVTLPNGRRAKISGPTREAVMEHARSFAEGAQRPADEKTLQELQELMRGDVPYIPTSREEALLEAHRPEPGERPASYRFTLPFGLGSFKTGGRIAEIAQAMAGDPDVSDNLTKITAATIGSVAAGPVMTGLAARQAAAPLLSRMPFLARIMAGAPVRAGVRFGPATAGAGAGGAVAGGALEADREGATPGSIAREAAETGIEMAGAELLGLGITAPIAAIAAPASTTFGNYLKKLDPLKGVRAQLSDFLQRVPGDARAAVSRIEDMLPQQAATNAREAAETLRGAASQASDALRRVIGAEAVSASGGSTGVTAGRIAKALGDETAARFGYGAEDVAPDRFIRQVLESGDEVVLGQLRERLGGRAMNDVLEQNLRSLVDNATTRTGQGTALNSERLLSSWRALPEATRRLYPEFTRRAIENLGSFGAAVGRIGRFAASPVGGEVAEAIAVPAATLMFGPGVAVPLVIGKALLNPGPTVRWLTRDKLPSEIVQTIGGQAVKGGARTSVADDRSQ